MDKITKNQYAYAGTRCPKCGKGINNEKELDGYEDIKLIQKKRYGKGTRICNQCLLEFAKLKSQRAGC